MATYPARPACPGGLLAGPLPAQAHEPMRPIALPSLLHLLLLAGLLCSSCGTLGAEEQDALAIYQRRALMFFDGAKYGQALIQIERGLELDPDDYKLNSLKGAIMLLASGDANGTDHAKLDQAAALLAKHFEDRSLDRHQPHLLLYYSLALQKQGLRHLGEAVRLEGQATRATEATAAERQTEAKDQRTRADEKLQHADVLLEELIRRGEMLRAAYNHRLQIARQRNDEKAFVATTSLYFDEARKAEQVTRQRIENADNVDYEQSQLQVLRGLHNEEILVRTLVAEFHYARREFQQALVHLNRVLEIDPRRLPEYYNRGRVLLELGRIEDAKNDFRRVLADPSIPSNNEKAVFAMRALDR
jgi:tetratricopeptide (TPR) repeat protein